MVESTSKPHSAPKLYLAPMEGVTDWIMRETLTQLGGIDYCVTEFLRVTKTLHPHKIFFRHCPELRTQSRTSAGTPVYFQLLGGDPNPMAENAQRVAELGAAGVDLNFGCPAKTVNRHDGGAVLLKTPHRLYDIAKKVRESVPANIPVSGKIRLGFEDPSLCQENALALQEAGMQWITVHCRTKMQGYRPPAHWHWIPKITEVVKIPVVANGDIDSLKNFEACQKETQAQHFMIGRASLSDPFLFKKIKTSFKSLSYTDLSFASTSLSSSVASTFDSLRLNSEGSEWEAIEKILQKFWSRSENHINEHFATSRTKQWLRYLSLKHPIAKNIFDQVKVYRNPQDFYENFQKNLSFQNVSTSIANSKSTIRSDYVSTEL